MAVTNDVMMGVGLISNSTLCRTTPITCRYLSEVLVFVWDAVIVGLLGGATLNIVPGMVVDIESVCDSGRLDELNCVERI